jgi:hypothetical protein
MPQRHSRIRAAAPSLLLAAAVVMLFVNGEHRLARAFVDRQLPTLRELCDEADATTALAVEKIDREKQAIIYSKVRDLKGRFPTGGKYFSNSSGSPLGWVLTPGYDCSIAGSTALRVRKSPDVRRSSLLARRLR